MKTCYPKENKFSISDTQKIQIIGDNVDGDPENVSALISVHDMRINLTVTITIFYDNPPITPGEISKIKLRRKHPFTSCRSIRKV